MKRLFLAIAVMLPFALVSCETDSVKDMEKYVRNQWVRPYTSPQGEATTEIWDIGLSWDDLVLTWHPYNLESDNSGILFDATFKLATLPDGRVKMYSEKPDYPCFYVFEKANAKEAIMYTVYYYDFFDSEGPGPQGGGSQYTYEKTELGWMCHPPIEFKANKPRMKMPWSMYKLSIGDKKYEMRAANYSYPVYDEKTGEDKYLYIDYDPKKALMNLLDGGTTLPLVRMSGYGSKEDFAKVDVKGKAVMVYRGGDIPFYEKMKNAIEAGAAVLLVANNVSGNVNINMGGPDKDYDRIPVFSITQEAGQKLQGKTSIDLYYTTDPHEGLE